MFHGFGIRDGLCLLGSLVVTCRFNTFYTNICTPSTSPPLKIHLQVHRPSFCGILCYLVSQAPFYTYSHHVSHLFITAAAPQSTTQPPTSPRSRRPAVLLRSSAALSTAAWLDQKTATWEVESGFGCVWICKEWLYVYYGKYEGHLEVWGFSSYSFEQTLQLSLQSTARLYIGQPSSFRRRSQDEPETLDLTWPNHPSVRRLLVASAVFSSLRGDCNNSATRA